MEELNKRWQKHLQKKQTARGLGDTISKITKTLGVKECGGCKKRKEYLNKKFPYKIS